ncbi:hypothetical protein ANN_10955 [Periplaneta americana]|uniref:Reverse transcriptase domain-containing protein n=1 Tax=Periplaneta americana TaxID=6978 RepID=A0ABQ8T5Z5_PERAM|nr:hypothetical protein ANN_10955 [Periplaneta americana]
MLRTRPEDLLVSFDVVSLFTKVPVKDTLELLHKFYPQDVVDLFHQVLTTTYFQWNYEFYEQLDGVAMGSLLSPMIANFYMEFLEESILEAATLKPSCWFRYVDDTFVIWPHGERSLMDFLSQLNSFHTQVQFTMETEKDGRLPFLDVMVQRRTDGTLGHDVYRKPTHTDRYLHKTSNHHPGQKRAMMKTLINRARRVAEPRHIQRELSHVSTALMANGYSRPEIKRALRPRVTPSMRSQERATKKGTVFLPYLRNVMDRISRVLKRHEVETTFLPTKQIRNMLRSSKDKRDKLLSAGVYRIPCLCGKVYIGTTQWSVRTRLTEHNRNCRLGQIDKSAVAAHAYQEGDHNIRFKDTDILSTTTHFFPIYREAIEIHKHNNNFNRKEEGVKLDKCWYPVLNRTDKKPLQQKDGTQNWSSEQSGADRSDNRPRPASRTINTPAQPDTGSVASDQFTDILTNFSLSPVQTVRVSVMDSKVAAWMGRLRGHSPEVMHSGGSVMASLLDFEDKKLMYPVQFQTLCVILNFPNARSELEKHQIESGLYGLCLTSSTYGVNLLKRIFDKILYNVNKSDIPRKFPNFMITYALLSCNFDIISDIVPYAINISFSASLEVAKAANLFEIST